MLRSAALLLGATLAMPAAATDVMALLGLQYNADMEVAEDAPTGTPGLPGDDISLDSSAAFTAAIDLPLRDPDTRLGALISHSGTSFGDEAGLSDDGLDVTHLHFTGTRYYPQGRWEPFVVAGVGAAFFSPDDNTLDSATKFSIHVGGGTQYQVADNLFIRGEARWYGTIFGSSSAAICFGGCAVAIDANAYSQVQASVGVLFRF